MLWLWCTIKLSMSKVPVERERVWKLLNYKLRIANLELLLLLYIEVHTGCPAKNFTVTALQHVQLELEQWEISYCQFYICCWRKCRNQQSGSTGCCKFSGLLWWYGVNTGCSKSLWPYADSAAGKKLLSKCKPEWFCNVCWSGLYYHILKPPGG